MFLRYFTTVLTIFLLSFSNCTESYNYEESGEASYYANLFIGRQTANGQVFSQDSLSAAHRSLPFGTEVLVTNIKTGRSLKVVINDRGPFKKNRIIDLTRRAADSLQFLRDGIVDVIIQANVNDDFLEVMEK